jgi:MerR family transcriptional regulator/heat shock protein HspR
MPGKDEPVFIISIAARMCEMHPQTLRQYERLGLVLPRRAGNNRLYSQRDIERLRQIQQFTQDMGVNLAGVEIILNLLERIDQMTAEAEHQIERMRDRMMREIENARREVEARFERRQRAKQLVPVSKEKPATPARKIPIRDLDGSAGDAG